MIDKKLEPPMTQRSFASGWGELDYLCKKVHYWLYAGMQPVRARRFRDRLQRILDELPQNKSAIVRAEAEALLCELDGRTDDAIPHRKLEIQLME